MPEQTTHVKVARFMLSPTGVEILLPLGNNGGGEAQLWEVKTWKQYHAFVQANPQCRGTVYYPWCFVEYMNPPIDDLKNYVLLPEKTGGREFQKPNAQ